MAPETSDVPEKGRLISTPTAQPAEDPSTREANIPSSESFTFEEVNALLCSRSGIIVALLGERDSGKSTLICSIYDRFLHGPFAGCLSCGIRTITGLERKAHLERTESGRNVPDTQHTSLAEGLRYFHFPVARVSEPGSRREVIVSDRAGELYKNARSNSRLVEELVELPSADFVVLLLDGERLSKLETRAGAFFAARQSLQMLLDCGEIDRTSKVQVVTTKLDLVRGSPDATALATQIEEFEARARRDFEERLGSLEVGLTALKPEQRSSSRLQNPRRNSTS